MSDCIFAKDAEKTLDDILLIVVYGFTINSLAILYTPSSSILKNLPIKKTSKRAAMKSRTCVPI